MSTGRPKSDLEPSPVKSVTKVLDILEFVGASKGPASVSDIARATGFNVSTAYRLLQTLAGRGYVEQHDRDRSYVLGHTVFQLGSAYLDGHDLISLVRPYVDELRDSTGEAIYLTVLKRGECIQLCSADGRQVVNATTRSVAPEPAYATAGGKVLLAGLSSDELQKYISTTDFAAHRTNSVFSKSKFLKDLGTIQKLGYALDLEEFANDLCCVSVPVHRRGQGTVVAAICLALPKSRYKKVSVGPWVKELQETANLITQKIGLLAI